MLHRFVTRWLFSTDHRRIGVMYLVFAACAGTVGGGLSVFMRMNMQGHALGVFSHTVPWNAMVMAHGLTMIFLTVMPALIGGFGTYLVPLMIGAPEMAFPRLSAASFWCLVLAAPLLVGGVSGGNTALVALALAGASSLLGAINLIATVLNMRAPQIALYAMPLFVWAQFVTAFVIAVSVPVLAGAVTMLAVGYGHGNGALPDPRAGDFRNLFWFFGHPEVYAMLLPAFGIVSQVVSTFSRAPVVGRLGMVCSLVAIGAAGFAAWAHHLFAAGIGADARAYFMLATAIVAVPAAIKVLSWIVTVAQTARNGTLALKTPLLWALGFVFLLVAGGVGEMVRGAVHGPRDAYDMVAHFHYVLSVSSVFAIFAGFYYWIGLISGYRYPELWGKVHFWVAFAGVNLAFFPVHLVGPTGKMPLWFPQIPSIAAGAVSDGTTAIGAAMGGGSVLVFLYVVYRIFADRIAAGPNQWGAGATTLEWGGTASAARITHHV